MTKSFEERFDERFPIPKIVKITKSEDTEGVITDYELKAFIRQEKELSRKEERARIKTMAENMVTVVEQMDTDFSQGQVDALDGLIQKINQEDK
jgi:hypothetical protein